MDREKYITNLSSKVLTPPQLDILSLGLKFVPSKVQSQTELAGSLDSFERGNRLKHFFRNCPSTKPHPFKKKSNWNPPKASATIEGYLKRVRTEVNAIHSLKTTPNLTPILNKALRQLGKDQTLVIKSADKGSGIVIEDTDQYVKDGRNHLSDEAIYEKVTTDPTQTLAEAINTYVESMYQEGIIDPITKEHLTLKTDPPPRTPQMYFLKKIHKTPISERPINSCSGGPTENIAQLIDFHLKPHVPKIPSYIRDSGHLMSLLESTPIPKDCTLATIDVKSLYLNIPHDEGIKAVLNRLYRTQEQTDRMSIPPGNMSDLLGIVLKLNYFQFADEIFHQKRGTAMGARMAPSYANIFMAELEEDLLTKYPKKPLLWKRYIDDILCIWPGPPSELESFMLYLNQCHPTIKFTYESSTNSVDFLDLTIYKGRRHAASLILDFKPFFKSTNKFQYLQYTSAHPRGIFASLTKGELTRLLRACSSEETYRHVSDKLLRALRERGYPNNLLQRTLQQVPFSSRNRLLEGEKKNRQTYDTFLRVTYSPYLDTRTLSKIIQPNDKEKGKVPNPCLSLSKTDNLAKTLVRAKLKQYPDPPKATTPITIKVTKPKECNSTPCKTPGCKCCAAISKKCRVTSTHNNTTYPTQRYTSCSTRNVVYLIECTKCIRGNQYIGQTSRPLKRRLAEHRAAGSHKSHFPLYKHFLQRADHNFERDAKITILQATTRSRLLEMENKWIKAMDCIYPKGLNSESHY